MDAAIAARNDAMSKGVADRNSAIDKGTAGRGAAIDKGVSGRNAAIDKGVAARNASFDKPQGGRSAGASPAASGSSKAPTAKPSAGSSSAPKPTGIVLSPTGRIEQAPKIMAPLAKQINKLRDQRKNTHGKNGIRVTVAEGNSIISLDPQSASDVEAATLSYSDGTITITIDANGVKLTNVATGDYAKMYTTGAIGCYDVSSGEEFTVAPSELANAGSIIPREFVVNENGEPRGCFLLAGPTYAI